MLEVDAFFLNEDRHTNNIAVLYDDTDETYSLCPLFDNGLSLLSDTSLDFPLERPLEDCLQAIEAKPFSRPFDDQLDAAEGLYGIQLRFSFGSHDVKDIIDAFRSEYGNDSAIVVKRLFVGRCIIIAISYKNENRATAIAVAAYCFALLHEKSRPPEGERRCD